MGIFDKVKARMNKDGAGGGGGGGQSTFSAPPPSEDQQLEQNLIRYRKQRGVNLGMFGDLFLSLACLSNINTEVLSAEFVLALPHNVGAWFSSERWIAGAPFEQAAQPGQSDVRMP